MAIELSASIAGLIGLAGLFVQSASSLYVFCRNVPKVREEIEAVADEAKTLKETLQTLEQLLARSDAQSLSGSRAMIALEAEAKSCTECLEGWLRSMEALLPQQGKRAKNVISVLKSAADSNRFLEMRTKLSSRRGQLSILIELLGLELGIRFQNHVTKINDGISELSRKQSSDFAQTTSKLESLGQNIACVTLSQTASRNTSDDILRSSTEIKQKLGDLEQMQRDFRGSTLLQVERMDSYLETIQKTLIESLNNSRAVQLRPAQIAKTGRKKLEKRYLKRSVVKGSTSSSAVSEQVTDKSTVSSYTVRLVDTAIRVRYIYGKAKPMLVPLSDDMFEEATMETKLRMIRQLQALRLLIWLLCEPDHLHVHGLASQQRASTHQSNLVLNAWLAKFWNIWDHRHWPVASDSDGLVYREPPNWFGNQPSIVRLSYENMLREERAACDASLDRSQIQSDAQVAWESLSLTPWIQKFQLLIELLIGDFWNRIIFPPIPIPNSKSVNKSLLILLERTRNIIDSLDRPSEVSNHFTAPDDLRRELLKSCIFRQRCRDLICRIDATYTKDGFEPLISDTDRWIVRLALIGAICVVVCVVV